MIDLEQATQLFECDLQPQRAYEDDPVLAADNWADNAALIVDCVRLGYLQADWLTLDPTYGRGLWWTRWQPDQLITHDLRKDGVDFRALPYPEGHFQASVFDPPYIAQGGRASSTAQDYLDRFGLFDAPPNPRALQEYINAGLSEVSRVTYGPILVKCKDYISSGEFQPGTHWTLDHAFSLGLDCIDRFEHLGGAGLQPPGRRQIHARRNLSTLFVFRKGKA